MKKIHIARLGRPGRQWEEWIQGLAGAGFEISAVSPMAMELQAVHAVPGDAVLLDGMLPNLSRYIQRICARSPGIHVIVATEVDSFTIRYEVMQMGAVYISGPMPPGRFVETICGVLLNGRVSAA